MHHFRTQLTTSFLHQESHKRKCVCVRVCAHVCVCVYARELKGVTRLIRHEKLTSQSQCQRRLRERREKTACMNAELLKRLFMKSIHIFMLPQHLVLPTGGRERSDSYQRTSPSEMHAYSQVLRGRICCWDTKISHLLKKQRCALIRLIITREKDTEGKPVVSCDAHSVLFLLSVYCIINSKHGMHRFILFIFAGLCTMQEHNAFSKCVHFPVREALR